MVMRQLQAASSAHADSVYELLRRLTNSVVRGLISSTDCSHLLPHKRMRWSGRFQVSRWDTRRDMHAKVALRQGARDALVCERAAQRTK